MAKLRIVVKAALATLLATYGVAMVGTYWFQRRLIYVPPSVHASPQASAQTAMFHEISVTTDDGLNLQGWYAPAAGKALTLVFFHGNGDCVAWVADKAAPFVAAGYGFLAVEYRGYGGMPGQPTETGLYKDAGAFIDYLIKSGIGGRSIVLYGHSLGTGVAVQMATHYHVGGVMLLAPFLSIAQMAQLRFPYFPVDYLVVDRFDNGRKIASIYAPILIANGLHDDIVPPSQGKYLFTLARDPKRFYVDPAGGHNDMFAGGFAATSLDWLNRVAAAQAVVH